MRLEGEEAGHRRGRAWGWMLGAAAALLWLAGAPATGQYFGQNKVPGVARDWRVIESPHFEFLFYEDERELADETLKIAERAYARLSYIYGHEVSERIPLILYGSQSEFRETRTVSSLIGEGTGGLTELIKRRVVVPGTGSIAELDHVVTHELTHAFQLDIIESAGARGAIDPLSWTPPLWVMEGLAEYLSVPGVDAHTEMWLRDATLEGRLPTLDQLAYVGDIRVYRFGQSIVALIGEQFGDEMLGPWLRGMARRRSFRRGTSEVLGVTVERLSQDWHTALRRRYLPEIACHTSCEEIGRRLTGHEETLANFHITPAVSPDGGHLTYIADLSPYADLYVASAIDGGHRRRLIRGQRRESFESLRYYRTSLEWRPDGEALALIALSGGRDRLVVIGMPEGELLREIEFGFDEMLSPTWSPDGERIAFVGLRGGYSDLYVTDAAGTSLEALTRDAWAIFQPAWSPDSSRIAFVTDRNYRSLIPEQTRSPWRIAILDLATREVSLLPNAVGKNINPQWFPDGRHLLYISDRTGISNLFVHDLELGRDVQLTDVITGVSGITPTGAAASLAANGRRVVFSVYARGGWDLYAIKDPLAQLAGREPWRPDVPAPLETAGRGGAGEGRPDTSQVAPAQLAADAADACGATNARVAAEELVATEALVASQAQDSTGADDHPHESRRALPGPLGGRAPPRREPPQREVELAEVYRRTMVLPETLSVVERDYRPRLAIDFAQAGGLYASGYGAVAQTLLSFSDMLGNRRLYVGAHVSGSIEEGSYYLGYLNQRRRPAFLLSLYQYRTGYGYGTIPGYPDIYRKRVVRGVGAGLIYPLSRFRRLEFFLDGVYEKRYEWLCEEIEEADLWRCGWKDEHVDQLYAAPKAALVFDSALFGSTGPLSGQRTRISAGVFLGEREASSATLDHRIYLNIRKRYAIAWRLVAAGEWGRDRERIAFGGPYSLRGYLDRPLAGTKIAFTNLEFRFPFVDYLAIAWPLRFGIAGIRGSLFFDLGAAWDDPASFRAIRSGSGEGSFRLEDLHASCGFRTSLNMGFAILRWDLTRRTDLAGWVGHAKGEFSMGWEF
ncbi:MAG: PD40 domain-containing protein [Candidatus Eisenbacteria sp.]|nr:PD40 domain-containing protein [Candidatus Eisenbacteria bacterium]